MKPFHTPRRKRSIKPPPLEWNPPIVLTEDEIWPSEVCPS